MVPALLVLACTAPEPPSAATPTNESAAPRTDQVAPTVVLEPESNDEPRLVALREGPLSLAVWNDRPYLLANGEPIPIDADRPHPEPNMHAGLRPRTGMYSFLNQTLAFGGELDGAAWVTTVQEHDRAAAEYDVYVREQGRWRRHAIEHGPIVEFYPDYVAREGAVLGLRAHASNPELDVFGFDDDGPKASAFRRKLDKALDDAAQGFVHLSGPSPAALPKLPPKLIGFAAATATDGTLYALARPRRTSKEREQGVGEDDEPTLLCWPPGKVDATQLELPGDPGMQLSLSVAGEHALIGGGGPYLASAHAGTIELVSLDGLPREDMIASAARTPTGELWIVLGDWNFASGGEGISESLWRRRPPSIAADSSLPSWERVALPTPSGELSTPDERWVFDVLDAGWDERTRKPITPEPAALTVAAAQGQVWIVADVGDVWTDDVTMMARHTAVYTTAPGTAPAVTIEPHDRSLVRQYAALEPERKPGSEHCSYVTLVLGEPGEAAAFEQKIEALEFESDNVFMLELYVGELDGKRELVLGLRAWSPDKVATELTTLAKALGLAKPIIDCRPRMLVEMIADL